MQSNLLNKSYLHILIFKGIKSFIGANNTKKIILKSKRKYLDRSKILFIHIPKAAGTSITSLLYGRRIGHFTFNDYLDGLGHEFVSSCFVFTVVRHPLDRIYSAWKFAKVGGTEDGAVNNYKLYQGETFKNFDSFVLNWLQYQDLQTCEVLFRTQSSFLSKSDGSLAPVDAIYKLENIGDLEIGLSKVLHREITLPQKNVVGKSSGIAGVSKSAVKKISELYSEDFKLFKYPLPDLELYGEA